MSDEAPEVAAPQPYAALLNIAGKLAAVVGAGTRGERAAKALAAHGADVVIIGATSSPELLRMEADGLLTVESRAYAAGDLEGAFLAVAASGSPDVDAAVAKEARERHVLLNVPADAAASDFIVPSVVTRGGLQVAISTGGAAPSATREARREVSELFGWEWGPYVELLGELRTLAIRITGLGDAKLAPLFAAVAASDLRERMRQGEQITAVDLYEEHAAVLQGPADIEGTGE